MLLDGKCIHRSDHQAVNSHNLQTLGVFAPYRVKTKSCLCQIGYREKAREEASRGGSLIHRPDIALATEVSKLTSQVHQTKSTIGLKKPWTSPAVFPVVPYSYISQKMLPLYI